MCIGLENYPQTEDATAAYPSGNIKDNPGDFSGTPCNQLTMGDIHQFFDKMLRISDIQPNGLPDNESNGFQYIDALMGVISKYQSDWVTLNMVSGFTGHLKYKRKVDGSLVLASDQLFLDETIKPDISGTVATLPEGQRPAFDLYQTVIHRLMSGNVSVHQIIIATDGSINIFDAVSYSVGNANTLQLGSVVFPHIRFETG